MKIAVAVLHGIGRPDPNFAKGLIEEVERKFVAYGGEDGGLVCKGISWADELQKREDKLWELVNPKDTLRYELMRRFLIDFAADAIAYQPTLRDTDVYDEVHTIIASGLRELARKAGGDAPLCIVAHSLGTVVASNYVYDQQRKRGELVAAMLPKDPPLVEARTLSHFFTLGSPLALWALRHIDPTGKLDFGAPIQVPAPAIKERAVALGSAESGTGWYNVYDKDDVIGFPLRGLNAAYAEAVREDVPINVGGLLTSWNPASHMQYWTDNDVTGLIGKRLAQTWRVLERAPVARP